MELQEIERQREEPPEGGLTHADDRVRLSEWLPPQWGEMPRIRFWKRWYNVLWIIPLASLIVMDRSHGSPPSSRRLLRSGGTLRSTRVDRVVSVGGRPL